MHYTRMFFEEEPNSNGYASKLEAFRTNDYSVIIDIQPVDSTDYDPLYSQSIELNVLDVRALAKELNRLATEIEKEAKAKKPVALITEGKQKKKTGGEIHARYTKDESGQLQIITAK